MYHAWQNMGEIGSNFGGSYMTDPLLLTVNRNCPMRRFLRKKTSFGYFCWEMPRMNMGVSQERKCLLNIVSQKLISYDFCTSFVLHKVKKTFGGSKWKLIELTRVSRYLAYVTSVHITHLAKSLHNSHPINKNWDLNTVAGHLRCVCAAAHASLIISLELKTILSIVLFLSNKLLYNISI